jgi:hypothetical protein
VTAGQMLAAIAGHGLYPTAGRLADHPPESEEWRQLGRMLEQRLLLSLALRAADSGALPVTEEQHQDLAARAADARSRRAAADRCLGEVVDSLERHGIDSCVLGGAATAALDYNPSTLRLYESVDLLVGSGSLDRAVSALRRDGLLSYDGLRSRTRKQRARACRSHNGVEVIFHASLTPKSFGGRLDASHLFANRVRVTADGSTFQALCAEERLLAASVAARLHGGEQNFVAQRDLTQLVLRDDLSVRKVARLASLWRLEALLAEAVRQAWDTFAVPDVVALSAWSRSYRPHRRDRRRLSAHAPQDVTGP